MLQEYVRALSERDSKLVSKLIANDLRARINKRGKYLKFEGKLKEFMEHERKNMVKAFVELGIKETTPVVSLSRLQKTPDSKFIYVWFAVGGHDLPKPFTFVREADGYKINLIPESITTGTSRYRVRNDYFQAAWFTCTGMEPTYKQLENGQETKPVCKSTCGAFFDGSTFKTKKGLAHKCDYNWWGIDVYIRGDSHGLPQTFCHDQC